MPFGAKLETDGIRFALWAPTAATVGLICDGVELPMPAVGQGWHKLVAPAARKGSLYSFRIDGHLDVPDPASRRQTSETKGPSIVVDPDEFEWTDAAWSGRPWEDAVLSEMHVGTATQEGTFAALTDKLERLADVGITAIELLPLSDCPGTRTWGYDGVLHYAPNGAYGSPDDLKRLVDHAHALGLMVFIDVVYNHFGPDGNYLHVYCGSFFTERHQTPWGAGLNLDGASGEVVREFFIHNALYWLEEFHVDGLRLDAVHAIMDDSDPHILAELATRVRAAFPDRHVHLVLENEKNEASWLTRTNGTEPVFYDAQWNDDIHHCWHRLLTGESESYYADFGGDTIATLGRCLAEGFAYQGDVSPVHGRPRGELSKDLPPQAFVAFLQNHDQVGNRAFGDRLTTLATPERLALARALLLLSPQIPMLFMGEEWASRTPFLYFVDFADDPALSKAIRDGRRREFRAFAAFADPHAAEIPDPTSAQTFTASKLDWSEAARSHHREVRAETRDLLRLRRAAVIPLLKSGFRTAHYRRMGPGGLETVWQFGDGNLTFLANFNEVPLQVPAITQKVLWKSAAVRHTKNGAELPAWTGLVLRGAP